MSPEAASSDRRPTPSRTPRTVSPNDNSRFIAIWVVIGLVAAVAAVIVILNIALAAPPQGRAQACAILNPAVGSASAELSSALDNIQANPTSSMDRLSTVSATFAGEVDKVQVAALKRLGATANSGLATLVKDIKSYLDGSSAITNDQLSNAADTVAADFTAIQDACK